MILFAVIFLLIIALYIRSRGDKASVLSVSASSSHVFSKTPTAAITLVRDLGVQGDCHFGKTVQHRSRLRLVPLPLNLRQVHLIHAELFDDLRRPDETGRSYAIRPGDMGENITTKGIDLLRLGTGTRLHFLSAGQQGNHAVVRVTGLRNPCPQIQAFKDGLQERCLVKKDDKVVQRKAGIMGVVEVGGVVVPGARIRIERPSEYIPLQCV